MDLNFSLLLANNFNELDMKTFLKDLYLLKTA
jgi:hypothetical protein